MLRLRLAIPVVFRLGRNPRPPLGPYTDYEWAELAGKHRALRWVLDDTVTWEDPGLGDT